MPQPSPAQHAEPNAKAKTQHQAHTNAQHPSQDGPGLFGFGKGIGSRPTLHDHCVCPFVARCATAKVGGAKAASVGRREGLALALPTSLGWSMLTSLAKGLGKSVSLARPSPC